MRGSHRICKGGREANPYADGEAFRQIFLDELNGLYGLSFLLTGDQEKAGKCVVSGIEDCVKENHVFKEWARSWAKRTIIQNAIRVLKPRPSRSPYAAGVPVPSSSQPPSGPSRQSPAEAVLRLGDFDRFVFVMCVLERYSPHDCALLLGCATSEIRAARVRALATLASTRPAVSFPAEDPSSVSVSVGA
jgi:DNA-directed RNA polymerase specialized sigma24 family protein